ncbi:RNA polymerase sigma factor [Schlesneria paludicola]|uniref:RNA polymerase sigma factor n=1 Tax=Schlesneria paludicola TaxID=360056 RepID=UPI00029B00A0|nr:sigma-70 family RNA polymerase sigma factor [Schlesneria paludicola]
MVETRVSLIQRVRNKSDEVAWTEFFTIYHPLLMAYFRKQGVLEHDAADLVQDLFTRLVPAMSRFEFDSGRGRFRTWLWRVTQNALTDWSRRQVVRNRAEQGWADQHEPTDADGASREWDEMYRRRILEVGIEQVRQTTQPATWACFEGKILKGRPASEVAAELGVSTNVVYVNASRVLARLRDELATFEESLAPS